MPKRRLFRSRFMWKLFAGYVVLILLTALLVGVRTVRQVETDTRDQIERSLHSAAVMLRELSRPAMAGQADAARLQDVVSQIGRELPTRLTVIDAQGVVLADTDEDPSQMMNHRNRPEIAEALRAGQGTEERLSPTLGISMRYLALRVDDAGGQALGVVRAALPLTSLEQRLAEVDRFVLAVTAAAVLLALVIGYVLSLLVTHPIRRMTVAARRVLRGDFEQTIDWHSDDEIGHLAQAFNRMTAELRRRMESMTKEHNEVRAILDSMVEGLVAVDRQERVTHMNGIAARLLQAPQHESLGKPIWEVSRVHTLVELVGEVVREEVYHSGEIRIPQTAGHAVLEISAAPMRDGRGDLAGALVVMHDITELRRLESVRKDFVANVSHELKTPLAAIRALIETMLDDPAMDGGTRRRFLDKVLNQSNRLQSLVSDLLALSRIESEETALHMAPLDLRRPVEDSVRELAANARAKNITLAPEVPRDPLGAVADAEALRQVVDNLVDNAIKYTPEGGRVDVRLREEAGEAVLEVADTGIGIEPRDQERVFERFYRVDKARSRDLGGTGLGLSIVKHIARAHGGDVSLESVPAQGTTFRVHLPLKKPGND